MLGVGTQTDEFLHGTLKTLLIPLSVSSVTERERSVVKSRWTKSGFVWPCFPRTSAEPNGAYEQLASC